MTDRLEALERLVRLRDQGALTPAEFAAEKERLLAAENAPTMPLSLGPPVRTPLVPAATAGAVVVIAAAGAGALFVHHPATAPIPTSHSASSPPPSTSFVTPASTPASPWRSLTPARARREAFVAAFGYAPPRALTDDQRATQTDDDGLYRPVALVPIGDHSAIIAVHQGPSYHAASGAVEVRYVDVRADGFHRFGSGDARVESGSFGDIGSWSLRRDLANNLVVAVKGSYSGMGCSTAAIGLIELGPDRPSVLAKGIIVDMDNTDEDNGPKSKWSARLSRSGSGISAYYTGTITRTVQFARRDGDVVALGALPDGC